MSLLPKTLTLKLRYAIAQFAYIPRALRLVWQAARGWCTVWTVLLVIQGLLPAAIVYLTRPLVNSLVAVIGAGFAWETIAPFLTQAALIAGIMLLMEVLKNVVDGIHTVQSELVQDHISTLIHEKSIAVDLAFYETPEYHDHLHRARDQAGSRSLSLLENGGSLLQNGVALFAIGAVLLPYGWWLPFVLVFSTLPALYAVVRYQWRHHAWWKQTTADRRRANYYDFMLWWDEAAAELRLFGWAPYFQSAFQKLRGRLRDEHRGLVKDQTLAKLGASAAALLIFGAVLGWMVWRAMQGLATLGDLALFYQAFSRGQGLMHTLLANAGQIFINILFLGNLFEFLDIEPQVADSPAPVPVPGSLREDIRFSRVTFRYPGSERPALQDFDLTIPAGQTVAIVGMNGAGKSTLIKLLCRFYDPDAGRIELDGIDIRDLPIKDLRRLITVLFQSPVPYHATAGKNIALGDLPAEPDTGEIEAAARGAGAHGIINRLPRGYETLLGKWFANGTELSEGERQRIALARAFLRRAQVVVLDEPTSFMDSWAEAEWLERFRSLVDGRTAIIITHRFTTALHADRIHVMQNGRIVESGSHDELLAQSGLYARSWRTQWQTAPGSVEQTGGNGHVNRGVSVE